MKIKSKGWSPLHTELEIDFGCSLPVGCNLGVVSLGKDRREAIDDMQEYLARLADLIDEAQQLVEEEIGKWTEPKGKEI